MITTRNQKETRYTVEGKLEGISDCELVSVARASHYRAKELAGRLGITVRQLERFFLRRFALTPCAWLQRLLAIDAQNLLQRGDPVKEVAAELGFSHARNFSRAFHRIVGISPSRCHLSLSNSCLGNAEEQMSHNETLFPLNPGNDGATRDSANQIEDLDGVGAKEIKK